MDSDQSLSQAPVAVQWAPIQVSVLVAVNGEALVTRNPHSGRASIPAAVDTYIQRQL